MVISPRRGHPMMTAALSCLLLGCTQATFARSEAAASVANRTSEVVSEAQQGEVAPKAQLLELDELAALSARNQEPGPEVRGGALSNEHLTYIAIALAAAVLVLILK